MHAFIFKHCDLFGIRITAGDIGRDLSCRLYQLAVHRYLQIGIADDSCGIARVFYPAGECRIICKHCSDSDHDTGERFRGLVSNT